MTFCPVIEIADELGPEAFAQALDQFIRQWCKEVGASSEELIEALDDRADYERRAKRIAEGD